MKGLLTISDVARRSGVAASALRYYEERGRILSERAGSGHRPFPRAVLRRIAFIVFAQKINRVVARRSGNRAVEAAAQPRAWRGDWAKLSAGWSQRIDNEIAQLQRLREGLTQCIGCGCLTLKECQFANPEDRAGKRGPGPRYWLP